MLPAREEDLLRLGRPAQGVDGALRLGEVRAEHAVPAPRLDLPVLAARRERLTVIRPAQRRHRAIVGAIHDLLDPARLADELERAVGAADDEDLGALPAVQRREPPDLRAVGVRLEQQRLRLTLHIPRPNLLVVGDRDELVGARPGDAGADLRVFRLGVLRDEEAHHLAGGEAPL